MLSCRQIYDLITEYDEGALTTSERRQFEQHVVICPPCRGFVSQIRATRHRLGQEGPSFPAELEESIVNAFRSWKAKDR
jgi:anti-sigma factor ChrR (cupin superfamily)